MKRTPFLTVLAGGALLLASCKNGNNTGLYIPKNAAAVFHIDPQSLSSKLTWEDIKKTTWFQDAYAKTKDSFAQKMMQDPQASGVDLSKDMAVVVTKRGRNSVTLFEGSVKDQKAFAAMLQKTDASAKATKDGEWNLMKGTESVTLWSDSKFAVVSSMPSATVPSPMDDSMAVMMPAPRMATDSLVLVAKQVLKGEGGSLFDDDRFAEIMKEKGDMHFWMNSTELYADMAGMMSMLKAGNIFKDNATGGTINFEDGKIAARFKQFYGKEMQKAMASWKMKDIDPALLDRIPSQNVIGLFAMNFDPAGIKEMLKALGMDGMANMFLSKQNLTLDEVTAASKGQFLLALTDLQMKDTTITFGGENGQPVSSFTTSQPDMSVLFATDVAQKPTFDKLMNMVKAESPQMPFTYQLNNDWFVAGNKPQAVAAFAAGKGSKQPFADKLKGHYCVFYLDVQRLLKTNFSKDMALRGMLDESAAVWQDVVMVADNVKGGVASGEMTINFVDGKTNSLKQLNSFIEKMNARSKAAKVAVDNHSGMPLDTVTPPAEAPQVVAPQR